MPTTLPAWLIVAFVAAVALTTLLRVLGLVRWLLYTIGRHMGRGVSDAWSRICYPYPGTMVVPEPLRYSPPSIPGVAGSKVALTDEQKLRARAEGIAAVNGTDADVVLAALREGGSFPDSVEQAAKLAPA